jgi:hypothetical protein
MVDPETGKTSLTRFMTVMMSHSEGVPHADYLTSWRI